VISCTGWTWEYVEEELDIPRLVGLNRYWAECPPTHLLLAGFVGYKPAAPLNNSHDLAGLFGSLRSE
jgi:hypothetical protein